MLNMIAKVIEVIPATFWGVVVGSFFSIAGVALSNRASDKRLRSQFEHERDSKTKDREMALRKEVFLSASEAVTAGISTIMSFANLDLTDDEVIQPYIEKASFISKVHVIARTETILPLIQFTGRLGTLFFELIEKRSELMGERKNIELIDEQIILFGKERDHILELIKQQNIDGINDQRRWVVLQENFKYEQKRVSDSLAQRDLLLNQIQPKQFEFIRQCFVYSEEMGKMLIPILIAIRQELELPLDEISYRQTIDAVYKQQMQAMNELVEKINK